MVTIYNYAFTMLGDCVVTVFKLLNHIHNKKKIMVAGVAWLGREFVKGERGFGGHMNW